MSSGGIHGSIRGTHVIGSETHVRHRFTTVNHYDILRRCRFTPVRSSATSEMTQNNLSELQVDTWGGAESPQ